MTNKDFLIEINSLTEPLSQVLGDLEENWKTSSIRVKEARAAVETALDAVENLQIDDTLVEESLLNVSAIMEETSSLTTLCDDVYKILHDNHVPVKSRNVRFNKNGVVVYVELDDKFLNFSIKKDTDNNATIQLASSNIIDKRRIAFKTINGAFDDAVEKLAQWLLTKKFKLI